MELKNLRGSLFGFNKSDVCEYISQLNSEFDRKCTRLCEEHRETQEEFSRKNESLCADILRLEEEKAGLEREAASLRAELAALCGRADELRGSAGELRAAVVALVEELGSRLDSLEEIAQGLRRAHRGEENEI